MDRCVERLADHPSDARGRSSDRSARSRSVHRSTGRPVGSPQRLVAAQSLVSYVRLAALCGLVRCDIAESPKGNRRRRSMSRRRPRELASGGSKNMEATVSTGVRIPGSEPVADPDDRSTGRQSQRTLRTVLRTIGQPLPVPAHGPALRRQRCGIRIRGRLENERRSGIVIIDCSWSRWVCCRRGRNEPAPLAPRVSHEAQQPAVPRLATDRNHRDAKDGSRDEDRER